MKRALLLLIAVLAVVGGVWVTTLRVQLNARSQKRFTGKFPHGVTKAQATVPKHPGFVAGFSTIKTIVR